MTPYPLQGIRVLDLCALFASNFATFILADLGAEVIKVESTQHWQHGVRGQQARPSKQFIQGVMRGGTYYQGDPGERPWERVGGFHGHSRNKLSMTVDLSRHHGVEIFKRLTNVSDIFIEGNSVGTVEKLGIDYPQLKEVNSGLIMVRMPGYGLTGPYRRFPALAQQLEAFCGHTLLRGYPDMDPTCTPQVIASNAAAGAGAALAALMALHFRDRTGKGQLIEVAQVENFMPLLGQAFMDYILNQRVHTTLGNGHPSDAPCGCYPCAGEDRWVAITVRHDDDWRGLRRALGDPEWARDPALTTVVGRHRQQDQINRWLAEWTQKRSVGDLMQLLQDEGVPCSAVMDYGDVLADPHLRERRHFQEITHSEVASYLAPGIPWRMSEMELRIRRPAPLLGEHNEYVYKELLGYTDDEYARLEAEGHIGNEPAPHIP